VSERGGRKKQKQKEEEELEKAEQSTKCPKKSYLCVYTNIIYIKKYIPIEFE